MQGLYDNTKKSRLTNTTKESNYYYEPIIKTIRKPFVHNETGVKIGEEVITTYKIYTNDCISKQQLISFLKDKIKENNKKKKMWRSFAFGKYVAYQEVLDFVNKGGKDE